MLQSATFLGQKCYFRKCYSLAKNDGKVRQSSQQVIVLNQNLRMYRQFHSDVTVNAPKDRTLFNYNAIVDGWPKLRQFLGLPAPEDGAEEKFPHENKGAQAEEFYVNLFSDSSYGAKVDEEVKAYFARNGYEVNKIKQ